MNGVKCLERVYKDGFLLILPRSFSQHLADRSVTTRTLLLSLLHKGHLHGLLNVLVRQGAPTREKVGISTVAVSAPSAQAKVFPKARNGLYQPTNHSRAELSGRANSPPGSVFLLSGLPTALATMATTLPSDRTARTGSHHRSGQQRPEPSSPAAGACTCRYQDWYLPRTGRSVPLLPAGR